MVLRLASRTALACGVAVAGGYLTLRFGGNAGFALADTVGMPLLQRMDAEDAHRAAIWAARVGLLPVARPGSDAECLHTCVLGMDLSNPLGLAAGFDKHAEAMDGLLGLGFGFVEAGSVTPEPQPGNPLPRVFRLPEDRAVINRYGFNSEGMDAAERRLSRWREQRQAAAQGRSSSGSRGVVGINLGKNKAQDNAVVDYNRGVASLGPLADYIVINVSSPNTPGLRNLQGRQQLFDLLKVVKTTRDSLDMPDGRPRPPLLVKIAPDLSQSDLADVCEVVMELGLDGMVVSNTTLDRPNTLRSANATEAGGLSGRPLLAKSTRTLANAYNLTGGKVALIGVGGVSCGDDAYLKIRAGASLVQLYSALSLDGPGIVPKIKRELAELLKRDGFAHVEDAVGVDAAAYPPLST
jgi:dihydroorotate dehydrogenase